MKGFHDDDVIDAVLDRVRDSTHAAFDSLTGWTNVTGRITVGLGPNTHVLERVGKRVTLTVHVELTDEELVKIEALEHRRKPL